MFISLIGFSCDWQKLVYMWWVCNKIKQFFCNVDCEENIIMGCDLFEKQLCDLEFNLKEIMIKDKVMVVV